MRKRTYTLFFTLITLTVAIVQPLQVFGQVTPADGLIMSDDQLVRFQSMSQSDIQHFLDAKGGFIKNYTVVNDNGLSMSISELIYAAAQTYQINPQFLLVLLQKEQGLVEDPNPSDYQINWATGYKWG